jgi:hypothetical protein
MQNRRDFLKMAGAGGLSLPFSQPFLSANPARPDVIIVLADDLGYGEVGCYGQKKIRTPNIDRLAREGMRFAQHYSGSPVCAPSRCSLLTGKHTGNAFVRDNDEMAPPGVDVWQHPEIEGQRPLPAGTITLGTLFQQAEGIWLPAKFSTNKRRKAAAYGRGRAMERRRPAGMQIRSILRERTPALHPVFGTAEKRRRTKIACPVAEWVHER